MDKIKISIISNETPLSERIKDMLNSLNIFEVDCVDNIEKCSNYYDILMIDMDSFKRESQKALMQIIKKLSRHKKIILLKDMDHANYLQKINILTKPLTEMKLINAMCNSMMEDFPEDISEIIV